MPVLLKRTAEPLSFAARTDTPPHPGGKAPDQVILADSQARRILCHEMRRYCDGLVRGRSFLVAGHRGSGKTTMVDSVILELQKEALNQLLRFKPLPVYVQGPLIFNGAAEDKPAAAPSPATPPPNPLAVAIAVAGQDSAAPAPAAAPNDDGLEQRVLQQVAQALHQSLAKEYAERFHLHARRRLDQRDRDGDELAELAARFQIELPEAPPPSRLRDFWRAIKLEQDGVLFNADHQRGRQQGMREMVALTGISHVYQRISGKLEEKEEQGSSQSRSSETQTGLDARWAELAKPLSALVAGGAVGSAAAASGSVLGALLLGVLTAFGAGLLFKMTTTTSHQRQRKIDRTFLPDLSTKTLHRVMPELFERLLAAGLAPVFVVDELDKVDDLYNRMQQLLDTMKKLFAERAFTCLLVDRGFYEQLHLREEHERRSAAPSLAPQAAGHSP